MIFPSTPFDIFPFPGRWITILKSHRLSFPLLSFLLFLVPNSYFELELNQTFSSFSNAPCHLFSTALCTYTLASTFVHTRQLPSLRAAGVCMCTHTHVRFYLLHTSLPARTISMASCFQVQGQVSGFPLSILHFLPHSLSPDITHSRMWWVCSCMYTPWRPFFLSCSLSIPST